jgi:Spy/CpxP family protein refolding chaperone
MKKLTGVLLAGSLALGLPLLALAQDQDTAPTDSAAAAQAQPSKNDGTHAGHGGWKGQDGFKQRYALTDDQSAKLKELFKSRQEEAKPLRNKIKVELDTLRLDVDSNASEGELKAALEKLAADKKTLEASNEAFKQKLQAILTHKQQAQMLLAMGGHRKGGWGQHFKGMGRGFGQDKPSDDVQAPAVSSDQP